MKDKLIRELSRIVAMQEQEIISYHIQFQTAYNLRPENEQSTVNPVLQKIKL